MYKKFITTALTCGLITTANAEDRAPSVWLNFNDAGAGDIIMQDVYVPSAGLATYTYYSILNWNAGAEGGGYAGIQDHPDGRNYIFSIWDPSASNEPIVAHFQGKDTDVENFGGEGTGLKSWNFGLGWESDQWYTLLAKAWDYNGHTYFGYWSHDQSNNKWTHLVTMDYPVANVRFNSSTGTFIEDWLGSGSDARSARYRNGHKRFTNGSWTGFSQANFRVVQESDTQDYNDNFDATANSSYYTMSSGGNTIPSVDTSAALYRNSTPSSSEKPTIAFAVDAASTTAVTWSVPDSSTPQFKYTIKINGSTFTADEAPEARCIMIAAEVSDTVEVTLEDILGKTSSDTFTVSSIGDGSECTPPVSNEVKLDNSTFVVSSTTEAESAHPLANAFDGDSETFWHTAWTPDPDPDYPHDVIIDLGADYAVSTVEYKRRADGGNGTVADYEIYVSNSASIGDSPVAWGTWRKTSTESIASFTPTQGRYVIFRALSEVNGNAWASASEINIYETLDEPVVDEPVVDDPVVDEPVVDDPVVDEPVVDDPVVDDPVVDEPVVDDPVVDEPVVDEPASSSGGGTSLPLLLGLMLIGFRRYCSLSK